MPKNKNKKSRIKKKQVETKKKIKNNIKKTVTIFFEKRIRLDACNYIDSICPECYCVTSYPKSLFKEKPIDTFPYYSKDTEECGWCGTKFNVIIKLGEHNQIFQDLVECTNP